MTQSTSYDPAQLAEQRAAARHQKLQSRHNAGQLEIPHGDARRTYEQQRELLAELDGFAGLRGVKRDRLAAAREWLTSSVAAAEEGFARLDRHLAALNTVRTSWIAAEADLEKASAVRDAGTCDTDAALANEREFVIATARFRHVDRRFESLNRPINPPRVTGWNELFKARRETDDLVAWYLEYGAQFDHEPLRPTHDTVDYARRQGLTAPPDVALFYVLCECRELAKLREQVKADKNRRDDDAITEDDVREVERLFELRWESYEHKRK